MKRLLMLILRFTFTSLFYGSLSVNLAYATNKITLIAEDYKPLSYLFNGELIGPSADIVKIINNKLNNQNTILIHPWKRGYVTTQNNPNTALFSTTRTEEREHLFKWVGPLAEKQFNLYALKDSNIKINKLIEARDYVIGVENGTINEQLLLSRGIDNLSKVAHPRQNLGKLLFQRIDLWCVASSTFQQTISEMQINPIKLQNVYTVKKAKLYIAFNKDTADEVIKLWQKAFDELYHDGIIKEIFDKYNLNYLYPTDHYRQDVEQIN